MKARNERGFVLVFTSISIVVLTGLGGLAVDVGNWYLNIDRLQKASDAASLSGAPYLPGDFSKAKANAEETLAENGIRTAPGLSQNAWEVNSPVDQISAAAHLYAYTVWIHQDPSVPSRLDVEVGHKVHNYLLGMIGVNDEWLVRQADGQYRAAVPMGSPSNVLGTEATPTGDTVQPASDVFNANYWLNIAGTQTNKITGDRYTAGQCTSNTTDGCPRTGPNPEETKAPNGNPAHEYIVTIPSQLVGHTVSLQAFDAASVDVGDHCDDNSTYAQVLGSAALRQIAQGDNQPANLYAAGPGPYCTGDYNQGFSGSAPGITFIVNKSDPTNNATGSPLKTVKFPGLSYNGDANTLVTDLKSNAKLGADVSLRDSFRRWATVYEWTVTHPGTYIITATTPNGSAGANRFSLRLGVDGATNSSGQQLWTTNPATLKGLTVYAKHDLTVYANSTAPVSTFYFAKLSDNTAGRPLTVDLYDIGDVPSGEYVDLQLVPPSGAKGSINRGFTGPGGGPCLQIGPDPANRSAHPVPHCTITDASAADDPTYNGRVVSLQIQVPTDYSCPIDTGSNCWMALRMTLHGEVNGAAISPSNPSTDTTTWQIRDCGKPVKLVKPGSPDDNNGCPMASGA